MASKESYIYSILSELEQSPNLVTEIKKYKVQNTLFEFKDFDHLQRILSLCNLTNVLLYMLLIELLKINLADNEKIIQVELIIDRFKPPLYATSNCHIDNTLHFRHLTLNFGATKQFKDSVVIQTLIDILKKYQHGGVFEFWAAFIDFFFPVLPILNLKNCTDNFDYMQNLDLGHDLYIESVPDKTTENIIGACYPLRNIRTGNLYVLTYLGSTVTIMKFLLKNSSESYVNVESYCNLCYSLTQLTCNHVVYNDLISYFLFDKFELIPIDQCLEQLKNQFNKIQEKEH